MRNKKDFVMNTSNRHILKKFRNSTLIQKKDMEQYTTGMERKNMQESLKTLKDMVMVFRITRLQGKKNLKAHGRRM